MKQEDNAVQEDNMAQEDNLEDVERRARHREGSKWRQGCEDKITDEGMGGDSNPTMAEGKGGGVERRR